MPEPFANAGADYLEQLLRAAMHVPAAAADPASGRVVARLMVALGAKREDERLEMYLSCSPGRRSVYEVTCYDEADRPASRVRDLPAGQAVRAATGLAAARPDHTVAVVARDDSGGERCVLMARGRVATYRFPAPGAPDTGGGRPPESVASTPAPLAEHPQWEAISERLASLPTTEDLMTAVRDLVGGMAVDLRDRLGALPKTDEFVGAVRDLLGGMTIELDATAIEDVIVAALDELPQAVAAAIPSGVRPPDLDRLIVEPPTPAAAADQHGGGTAARPVGDVAAPRPAAVRPAEAAAAVPPRVVRRPAPDRRVDDAPPVVTRSRRRGVPLATPVPSAGR